MQYTGICIICTTMFSRVLTPSNIAAGKGKYCSRNCYGSSLKGKPSWNKGLSHTESHRLNLKKNYKGSRGIKWTYEQRKRASLNRMGKNSPNWKGGITKINKLLRRSFEFKEWRRAVFERDNYTCQFCRVRGGELHPDHIKAFAGYPELRFELSNGRTLCAPCHRKTPTWGARKKT